MVSTVGRRNGDTVTEKPVGAIIGDFEVTRQPEDVYFIEQMSHVAAAAPAAVAGGMAFTFIIAAVLVAVAVALALAGRRNA